MFRPSNWAVLTHFFHSVPGEAGRNLVQRYFEAEHSTTAIIHPRTELAYVTPDRRDRRLIPHGTSNSSRRGLRRIPLRSTAPAPSLRPSYGSTFGQAIPARHPYTGSTPLNNRAPPVPLSSGTFTNVGRNSTNYPSYRHGSFPFWH